ncbi:phage protease [Roseibium sp. TrichSKD4]|uniref:prohead protease/major capsid protein fusion protein n=1 Tax=Roseibium sp. TrichSKD4 TaxID=744980 RepID=UPI0001E56CD1|nr:prohead protease/major capsid protein fusion protein [Roseibium sp. TrichSKD4]EFO32124.1 phage protease [Roseibium sp. TrichSKD4]
MPIKNETIRIRKERGEVEVRADTLNEEDRTVEVIWATEAPVKRYSYSEGYYMEVLSMETSAIRMERFENGMSLLDSHFNWSMDDRIGTIVPGSIRFEDGKGHATVKLSRKQMAEDLLQDLRDGHPFPVSVGYKIHRYEKSEGEDGELPTLKAIDWEPMELSAVPIPADAGAHSRSEDRETYECDVIRHVQEEAADAAIDNEDTNMPKPLAASQEGQDVNTPVNDPINDDGSRSEPANTPAPTNVPDSDPVEQGRNEPEVRPEDTNNGVHGERQRSADILQMGQRHNLPADMVNEAIRSGVSVGNFRQQTLNYLADIDEQTPTFSIGAQPRGGQDEVDTRRAAMQNALLHRVAPGREELTDAARQYRGLRMIDMARECLEAAGEKVRGLTPDEIAKRAFHTSTDFPILLEGTINRQLRSAYDVYPQTFRGWARQSSATDFREMHRIQVGEVGSLLPLNEDGEYESTTLGEGREKYRIGTFGRKIGITRKVLVNDDLSVFTNLPSRFGNAIARLESNVVYNLLLDNPKMSDGVPIFHGDHNNLSALALTLENIAKAKVAMLKHKGVNSEEDTLDIQPDFILLPPELEFVYHKLMGIIHPTKTDDVAPDYVRRLTPVIEPRLSKIGANAWHLAASPNQIDTIEYAYLEGNEGPYVETNYGFEVDGMQVKVRLDFGAGCIDYRGLYRNKPA